MVDLIFKCDGQQGTFEEEKSLKVVIPICSCCKKIHVNKKSWQHLDITLSEYSNAPFSHGLCPRCYEKQRSEFMKFKSQQTVYQS